MNEFEVLNRNQRIEMNLNETRKLQIAGQLRHEVEKKKRRFNERSDLERDPTI
jgi:hypothetical protein